MISSDFLPYTLMSMDRPPSPPLVHFITLQNKKDPWATYGTFVGDAVLALDEFHALLYGPVGKYHVE